MAGIALVIVVLVVLAAVTCLVLRHHRWREHESESWEDRNRRLHGHTS